MSIKQFYYFLFLFLFIVPESIVQRKNKKVERKEVKKKRSNMMKKRVMSTRQAPRRKVLLPFGHDWKCM